MMVFLRRFLAKLLYGGSFQTRDYERKIISCVCASLGDSEQAAIDTQLRNLKIIQRFHQDRMVTFSYLSPERLPKLTNDEPDLTLAWVAVRAEAKTLRVKVVAHRGLFFGLQFSRPPRVLQGKHLNLALTSRTKDDRDLDRVIDAAEHDSGEPS